VSILVVSFACSSVAFAAVPPGSGTLTGTERFSVSGCGKDSGASSVVFTIASDGAWSAMINGNTYVGSSTANGNGRFSSLSMDGPSFALFTQALTSSASDLCADVVTVSGLVITKALLKVNKSLTAAKLEVQAVASGSAGGNSGRGKYKLKASGGWQVP
jgi:hypothetical protein